MSANEDILDAEIRHQIYLERLKAGYVSEIATLLGKSDAAITELLRERLDRFADIGLSLSPAKREALASLIAQVSTMRTEVYGTVNTQLSTQLLDLANYEVDFQRRLLERNVPVVIELNVPNPDTLRQIVRSRPMQGKVLREWVQDLAATDRTRLTAAIQAGVAEGQTTQQILQRVRGTRVGRYEDGILQISRRNAEAVTRTAVSHVTESARAEMWRENADILSGVRFTATLDGRTTPRCRALDGQSFPVDRGPRPPLHWRCRSTVVPVVDGMAAIGNRPTITDTRTRRQREIDFRAEAKEAAGDRWRSMSGAERTAAIRRQRETWTKENIGSTPAATSYQDWLKKQPAGFQDDVLGKAKGKLFRDGGLTLDRFVDQNGKAYTLPQLRERDAAAFEKAGL